MDQKAKKILIVEDEIEAQKYLSVLLENNGFETIIAKDGKEGMEKAKNELPDLISLDINMPNSTGIIMLRDLHDDPGLSKIPVVITSGVDISFKDFILKERKQINPPLAYFEKPIVEDNFIFKIKEILKIDL